ncbi:MAG TPA: TonB-dependent receptor [Flavobacteriaceae bacterium]|jgi:iron complex outermembrane receptor protein|nr:TonB-dependent receptor [Flavobacteriaceae bacterium]
MKNTLFFLILLLSFNLFSQTQVNDTILIKKQDLEEVVVSAFRASKDTPMSFTEIDAKDIAPLNLGQDLPTILNFTPSVVTHSDAGNGVGYSAMHIRGSDETRINVTLNGIPLNDSESQLVYWVNMPDLSSSISNIQIQRGVGTSTNGSGAFGGSINILTDIHSDYPSTEISNSFGSYGTLKNSIKFSTGLSINKIEFSGRFSNISSDGYIDRASSDLKSYFLQGIYETENTVIKILNFAGHEITYQSWYGIDGETLMKNRTYNPAGIYTDIKGNTKFYDNQEDNYKQDHYQFHWNQKLNNNWTGNLSFHYTHGRGYYEEYMENQHVEDYGLEGHDVDEEHEETDLVRRLWLDNDFYGTVFNFVNTTKKYELIFGGSYNNYLGEHFGKVIWAREAGNSEIGHKFYDNYGDKNETNLYSKLDYHLNDKLSLFGDIQFRNVNYKADFSGSGWYDGGHNHGAQGDDVFNSIDKKFNFLNPKIGLYYKINDRNDFYISYAKAQREPTRADYENGNPYAETLNDFEIGWKRKNKNSKVNLNIYFMDYKDQLVLTGETDGVGNRIRANVGNSYRLGLEFDAIYFLSDRFIVNPNFTLSSNKNKDYYFNYNGELKNFGDTNLSFSPELILANSLTYKITDDFSAFLNSKYIGEQYMSNTNVETSILNSFVVNDLGFKYKFSINGLLDEVSLNILVNNVFDYKYASHGNHYFYDLMIDSDPETINTIGGSNYFPMADRNFLMGINLKF